jgi:hypothetical protein
MVPPTTPMQQWKGRFRDWRHSNYTEMAKHSEYVELQMDARIPGNGPTNVPGNASNHFPGNNSRNIKPSTAGPTSQKSNNEPNMSTYGQRKKAQPTGEQLQRLARFDWLLRTLLNTLDAIHNEFGGIPDEIQIVRDRFDRHIGNFTLWNIGLLTNHFHSSSPRHWLQPGQRSRRNRCRKSSPPARSQQTRDLEEH